MSDPTAFSKMFFLALGFYLFTSAAHTATSRTHGPGVLDLAFHRLASLQLHPMPTGAEDDPAFGYLLSLQP